MIEVYKTIPNFEGYEISESGILRSKNRIIIHKNGKKFTLKSKQISYKLPKNAKYYQVHLYQKGTCKLFRIHQLVALAWLPNPNNYPIVNHIDGDKFNNHKNNLEWCSYGYNILHCKNILGKNLNISLTKINELYQSNKNLDLISFINLLKQNCK